MNFVRGEQFLNWLWPRGLESTYPEEVRARVERLVRVASLRARRGMDDTRRDAAILGAVDLRQALVLSIRAHGVAEGDGDRADSAARFAELFDRYGPAGIDRPTVVAALGATSPLYFEDLRPDALAVHRGALAKAGAWLRACLDTRSAAYLRGSRLGRILAAGLVIAFLGCKVSARFGPVDVALGKPVSASGFVGGSGRGLVDGIKDGSVGVQTTVSEHPWVQIDLTRTYDIRRIVIYNRGDRNLDDGLPYDLEVSDDQRDYRLVAHRDEAFGDGSLGAPSWTVKARLRARYVRLRALHYIALSEVEVLAPK